MSAACRGGLLLAASVLAACAAAPVEPVQPVRPVRAEGARLPPAAPGPRELRNAGFEDPTRAGERCAAGWSCTMHADPNSYRFFHADGDAAEGRRSYCIERVTDEPFGLATQVSFDRALAGQRMRYSLMVRTEGATGKGAGPWALAQVRDGRRPPHTQRLVSGTRGWERVAIEFTVPGNMRLIEFGATLLGPGRACFDDARLEVLP